MSKSLLQSHEHMRIGGLLGCRGLPLATAFTGLDEQTVDIQTVFECA